MSCPLTLRREAGDDIRSAARWYDRERPGLGTEFTRAVRAQLAAVARNPLQYPTVGLDVRHALLRRFPYALYFALEDGGEVPTVVVLACLHVRRDPSVWRERR